MGKKSFDKAEEGSNSSTKDTEFSGAFIDHRQHHGLVHAQTSPARTRRRNSLISGPFTRSSYNTKRADSLLPLTDRNLRSLDSGPASHNHRVLAIDMDKYTREQSDFMTGYGELPSAKSRALQHGDLPYRDSYHEGFEPYLEEDFESESINSMGFGESKPPSEQSGDLTSLDDVCFPDYYENEEVLQTQWPDLRILQEFIDEESQESLEGSEHVNFKPSFVGNVEGGEMNSSGSINQRGHRGYRGKDSIPAINSGFTVPILQKKRDEACRFTYFRDDLANTVHAPTLSGLLTDEQNTKVKEQPTDLNKKWRDQQVEQEEPKEIMKLEDLFLPQHYSGIDISNNISGLQVPMSPGNISGYSTPVAPQISHTNIHEAHISHEPSAKNLLNKGLGLSESHTPGTGTITDSAISEKVTPFWLDVLDPTEEEMKVLSKTFGIHPLTTEDIFLGEAREKVELFKSYYFICFTSFDVVYERRKQKIKEKEKKLNKLQELNDARDEQGFFSRVFTKLLGKKDDGVAFSRSSSSHKSAGKKVRDGELSPLSMYMIVFKHAVITFHFSPTPHPINVRRRARLLKDYLTVSSDWICYALIDDITDSFAPMIESIEHEVNLIEEAILRMHAGESESESDDSDSEDEEDKDIFYVRKRSRSIVDRSGYKMLESKTKLKTSSSSKSKSTAKVLAWKRKGDMLRRIGECRKRVMSLLRLLGSKADVIKGFSKRLNETGSLRRDGTQQSKLEITMYLGDIQDHIVTMVQSLNHYEKLLARFHSNYLAQINIDMTKVNNDTNDVLGKITILGTIVLPINVVTGLWGMNCLVPGQSYEGLAWFWSIVAGMVMFAIVAYNYAKKAYGL